MHFMAFEIHYHNSLNWDINIGELGFGYSSWRSLFLLRKTIGAWDKDGRGPARWRIHLFWISLRGC